MRFLFIFLSVAIFYSCSEADKPSTAGKASATDSTNIEWIDPVSQDLGSVNQGAKLEITWKFRNSGTKPLVISEVRAGCGCTGAEGPKEPIAPGKEGTITARFDSEHYPGPQTKQVYVSANARTKSGTPAETLTFNVQVKPKK